MFADLIMTIFWRQLRPLLSGAGRTWQAALGFLFGGVLALIVLSGTLHGIDPVLAREVLAVTFWLLLFVSLGFEAANLWTQDAQDGTLDQDFVTANATYVPLILASFASQIFTLFLPLGLIFVSLWALGLSGTIPLASLAGLILPIISLRMLASALALRTQALAGAGSLFFLSLVAPFFFLSVAGRPDLIWALGLIFAPLCLALLPFVLSLSHRAR